MRFLFVRFFTCFLGTIPFLRGKKDKGVKNKMQIISSDVARELLNDEWAKTKLYNIDYTHHDNTRLALYPVNELSPKSLQDALAENQMFLFDGTL